MNATINTTDIDRLGHLLAEISKLTAEADAIKASLKEEASLSGQQHFDGAIFRATYVESNRSTTDWKGIAKAFAIPAEAIAKATKTTAVFSVKIVSL